MRRHRSKQWAIPLYMIMSMLISFACQSSPSSSSDPSTAAEVPSTATEDSGAVSAEVDVEFGSGPFDFPETSAGLADLSSYKATLIVSFDGTSAGQTQEWSKTYIMVATKEPARRQLTIEKTGDLSNLDSVFMAEVDGTDYERRGASACTATVMEQGNSLSDRLEPAGLLSGAIGAEAAGTETVNGVTSDKYTFDERASGQFNAAQSTGEMWVASEGGYLLKYLLTTQGSADYFGEGIEGTLTLDYVLSDVNVPITFDLLADCPAGMVNAPLLPDAADVVNVPGVLFFDTLTNLTEAVAFYREQMPSLGWTVIVEPVITEADALMKFTQANQTLTVAVTVDDAGVTTVTILLEKVSE